MRRVLLALLALTACRSAASEPARPTAVPATSSTALASAAPSALPAPVETPPPAPAVDGPLAWGTRPAGHGPLYPVVDGWCVHGEVWPLGPTTLYSYGAEVGTWSAGGVTTFARLTDDGLALEPNVSSPAQAAQADAWEHIASIKLLGTWPAPAVLYSKDNGQTRMRSYESIWTHGDAGWTMLASWRDAGAPSHAQPALFKGHLITSMRTAKPGAHVDDFLDTSMKTWPMMKDAPPIPGIASLLRPRFEPSRFVASDTTIYALDYEVIRWLTDGKVGEVSIPDLYRDNRVIGTTSTALYLLVNERLLIKLEGGKLQPVSFKLPVQVALKSVSIAPDGDLWAITSRSSIVVLHRETVTETQLPKPASPRPAEKTLHWPTTGRFLAGVEVDDPYAIGEGGSVFHLEGGSWKEVELPLPPFAANGKYQAQAITVPAKGDVLVNAGYAEKGVGWRTEERYRALLRNKKPKEVLRCNEPRRDRGSTGIGFMSFPPIATEACTTPFVILLRVGLGVTGKEPSSPFGKTTDYPSVREAIKETAGLGETVDLVEVVAGDQRYLGARVPNVAAGKALALSVVKKVKVEGETRPEVVCGKPKEERVLHVDAKTGSVK